MTFERLFILGLCAHIIADWFFQNDWQAQNKGSLKHPAAWIHSGIHLLCFAPIFGWWSLGIFATHILIDTRKPLIWWRTLIGMKQHDSGLPDSSMWNQVALHVAFWQDQMAHMLVIAAVAWVCQR